MISSLLSSERLQLLDEVPSPDLIRKQIEKRQEEGRLLRSLYRLSQRMAKAKKEYQPEVSHAG